MTVCLASQRVKNRFLRKRSTKSWAQWSDSAMHQSWITNAHSGIRHRACFTLCHAFRDYFKTLLLRLRIKVHLKILLAGWFSVTQIENRNRSPAVIFSVSLGIDSEGGLWERSHRPSGPALMRNLHSFSNLHCAARTCKGPWRNIV